MKSVMRKFIYKAHTLLEIKKFLMQYKCVCFRLGAAHDGEKSSKMCNAADGYIMSPYDRHTKYDLVWSECSRKVISLTA